ncbi:MAG TPA: hypothetical protein VFT99_15175 [Roseiflexaceae bacterium]|nr:hypothetical protein [Roseiflexaceae bacterium]
MISPARPDLPTHELDADSRDMQRGLIFLFGTVAGVSAVCALLIWMFILAQ